MLMRPITGQARGLAQPWVVLPLHCSESAPHMSFLDTQPAPIDRCDYAGPWSRFRVRDPRKQVTALLDISRHDKPVTMGAPGGPTITATLWSVDNFNGRLHFQVAPHMPQAHQIAQMAEIWAAAYLDDAKLQFSLPQIVLRADADRLVLVAEAPQLMYLLPRRGAMRVRRDSKQAPTVRFVHPQQPGQALALRVLDISATGCALSLPAKGPALIAGSCLRQVEVELDNETMVFADLLVHHVTQVDSTGNARVGCEWQGMPAVAQERLQRWIQQGRRRRELISLSFD